MLMHLFAEGMAQQLFHRRVLFETPLEHLAKANV